MRWRMFVALLVSLTLFVAACGDDDDEGASAALTAEACDFVLTGALGDPTTALLSGSFDPAAARDQLEAIAAAAPEEIKADFAVLAEGYGSLFGIIADVDFTNPGVLNDPAVQEAAGKLAELGQDADFAAASAAVNTYFETNCATE